MPKEKGEGVADAREHAEDHVTTAQPGQPRIETIDLKLAGVQDVMVLGQDDIEAKMMALHERLMGGLSALKHIREPFRWGLSFEALMLSAPEDADLLKASNWKASNYLPSDAAWAHGRFNGWLEGNAVATPEGGIVDILRVDLPKGGRAAVVPVSAER